MDWYDYEGGGVWYRGSYYGYNSENQAFYNAQGQVLNSGGGGYHFDWIDGTYKNGYGQTTSWNEVECSFVNNVSTRLIDAVIISNNWSETNPLFRGFHFSDGSDWYTNDGKLPEDFWDVVLNAPSGQGGNKGNIDYTFGPYTSWTGVIGQLAEMANKEIPSKVVRAIGKYATRIGWTGEIVTNVINGINVYRNPTWGNYGRLTVSLGTTGLNVIPYGGPMASFIVSSIDAGGGFNNFYNSLDQSQAFYMQTGIVILPNFITPGFGIILDLRK